MVAKRKGQRAVAIPPISELDEHARAIRMLGRRSFEDMVEIGRRLVRCRELLKARRTYLAWARAEFGWSHTHCDRAIAVFEARDRLHILCNLGVGISGLCLLAKASSAAVERVRQRVEAGERLLVTDIRDEIVMSPTTPRSGPRYISPPAAMARRPTIMNPWTAEAAELARRLTDFAYYVHNLPPISFVEVLSGQRRATVLEDVEAIADFLEALRRSLREGVTLKVVGQDDEPAKH